MPLQQTRITNPEKHKVSPLLIVIITYCLLVCNILFVAASHKLIKHFCSADDFLF